MERKNPTYQEIKFYSAEELWEAFSPTRNLGIKKPHTLIFRGQADSEWKLIPSVLRNVNDFRFIIGSKTLNSEEMIINEIIMLREFFQQCDRIGIRFPNEGKLIRDRLLEFEKIEDFILTPSNWPDVDILDFMAMAQHHGVPTRLLDWTQLAYIAVYFAASSALANHLNWTPDSELAIWVLNVEMISLHPDIKIHKSAGSVSPHLAAQYGQFTIHPHKGIRGKPFQTSSLDEMLSDTPESPLYKITLPVFESGCLLSLCNLSGFSASNIYPSADGAGKGVIDSCNLSRARRIWNRDKILVRAFV